MKNTEQVSAYPLAWPVGVPRCKSRQPSRFRKPGCVAVRHSIDESRRKLFAELGRLGAARVILSSNIRLRLDGFPVSGQPNPQDTGVAVYFNLKGKRIVLQCDKWQHATCNIWAIACHIESLRGQDRWGVGSIEQAFAGYVALNPPSGGDPWTILGITREAATEDLILDRYRTLARVAHPDAGGTSETFHALTQAKDMALANI